MVQIDSRRTGRGGSFFTTTTSSSCRTTMVSGTDVWRRFWGSMPFFLAALSGWITYNLLSMDTFDMESKLGTVATATTTTSPSYVCHDFFAVLANVWVPNNGNCTQVLQKHREMFQVQNDQMNAMNSHLTVFTTWSPQELQDAQCTSLISSYSTQYPHVKLQQFDPQDLLTKHDALFNQTHIGWIKAWADTVPRERHAVTQLSDLFRLALQLEHHMTYIDLDVIFLNLDPTLYGRHPNVAAPMWSEEKGALEIQNSAFCFSTPQLQYLLQNVRTLMDERGNAQTTQNMYIYTQLGPNLFQHSIQVMQMMQPVQLYYTNSDDHWKVEDVARQHQAYGGFMYLHLDGSNRRRNWYRHKKTQSYPELVEDFREACPPLLSSSGGGVASGSKR